MRTRRGSVPPGNVSSEVPRCDLSKNAVLTVSHPRKDEARDPALLDKAESLARMSLELNIHAVGRLAAKLERDLKELVKCTGEDRQFRANHEARLKDMWQEIVAVKTRVEEVGSGQDGLKLDYESCQQETKSCVEEFKREVASLREMVADVSGQLGQLPTAPLQDTFDSGEGSCEAEAPPIKSHNGAPKRKASPNVAQNQPQQQPVKRRIQETISSTRRWNMDHKTTDLPDSAFVAGYLKQQSKRDRSMAVHIQRCIQKRIRQHLPRSRLRPASLEEFCEDVTWKDVIETVEDALVRHEDEVVNSLR